MRTIPDLHPDDTVARHALAERLRVIRECRNITQAEAAERYGCDKYAFSQLERRRTWHVHTVQAMARIYGYRLTFDLGGLMVPDDGDPLAALYDASQPTTEAAEDRLELLIVVNNLTRIRRAANLSLADAGLRMGCSESAVYRREADPGRLLVSTLQRHTRALGGVLDLSVVPAYQGAAV
ncbi:helix-turn-helix domain-containing protein [Micromonospora sp. NPDC050695]|uniref:helix-turn-helix domain-containing protein n=1 Tax=Micromonospora sp. NPDC050695 TaxID=3154938 RepID=UPI0033D3FFE4